MLTVLMATCNGAQTLPQVLAAYCRLQAPRQPWQLVIVENGSTDATAAIVSQYRARLPLHMLCSPVLGKNAALNLGLEWALHHAGSDGLFIFSDDDATPAADWLRQWERCAHRHNSYAMFGGGIEADWAAAPPAWLLRLVPTGLTFGLTAADQPEGPIFAGLVWGANMALRAAIFAAGYRYDTSIGPCGHAYAMGSETELTRRLAVAGYTAWFCPQARVAHRIRLEQMRVDYVLQKAWRFGRGQYRQASPGVFPEWRGVPRWMWRRYALELITAAWSRIRNDADGWFQHCWELAYLRGYCHEARQGRPARGKRVLMTSYSGQLGGMEMRMAQEVRYLRQQGAEALLALPRFAGIDAWAQRLAAEQIVVAYFEPPPFFEQWAWRRWNVWRARWTPARRLRAFQADLVHVAWCWTHYGASALWLAHYCQLPTVISVHNAFPSTPISRWHQPLLQQAFTSVRGVYAVSASALAHFLALYQPYLPPATRLAVIPNCVDTERYQPDRAIRRAARARLGIPAHAMVIGVAARLVEQKRPELLLDVYGALRRRFPQLYLVLLGSGPLEARLRQRVLREGWAPHVRLTGFVPMVERLLPALDLHVLMSRNEGFGIATIEAMACGVPVVATDVPGSADILRDSAAGLLLPKDDVAVAADMVAQLLADPRRRALMGRLARAEAQQRYSCAVVGRQVQTFYAGLC